MAGNLSCSALLYKSLDNKSLRFIQNLSLYLMKMKATYVLEEYIEEGNMISAWISFCIYGKMERNVNQKMFQFACLLCLSTLKRNIFVTILV